MPLVNRLLAASHVRPLTGAAWAGGGELARAFAAPRIVRHPYESLAVTVPYGMIAVASRTVHAAP